MKNYYRVRLGSKAEHVAEALQEKFIGADFSIKEDLGSRLAGDKQQFVEGLVPVFLGNHPEQNANQANAKMRHLWTVLRGIEKDDVVLCPDGKNRYQVCEVEGNYFYVPNSALPHRRPVTWFDQVIDRNSMTTPFRHLIDTPGTVRRLTKYAEEIEALLGATTTSGNVVTAPEIYDRATFELEKHLEDFLVQNWRQTELGKEYDIYEEDGERIGQQYETDTGPIDILAISKDKRRLLVVELKKGRPSDKVVGQVQRYMGYVQAVIAQGNQAVQGAIIAPEDDLRIRRALSVAANIEFYRYEVSFKLHKT